MWRNFLAMRYALAMLFWNLIRALGGWGVLLVVVLGLWIANAKADDCPPGTIAVVLLVNNQPVYRGCRSAAELERAGYVAAKEGDYGTLVCRVLIVKERR